MPFPAFTACHNGEFNLALIVTLSYSIDVRTIIGLIFVNKKKAGHLKMWPSPKDTKSIVTVAPHERVAFRSGLVLK